MRRRSPLATRQHFSLLSFKHAEWRLLPSRLTTRRTRRTFNLQRFRSVAFTACLARVCLLNHSHRRRFNLEWNQAIKSQFKSHLPSLHIESIWLWNDRPAGGCESPPAPTAFTPGRPLWQTPSPDVKVALHSAGGMCFSLCTSAAWSDLAWLLSVGGIYCIQMFRADRFFSAAADISNVQIWPTWATRLACALL